MLVNYRSTRNCFEYSSSVSRIFDSTLYCIVSAMLGLWVSFRVSRNEPCKSFRRSQTYVRFGTCTATCRICAYLWESTNSAPRQEFLLVRHVVENVRQAVTFMAWKHRQQQTAISLPADLSNHTLRTWITWKCAKPMLIQSLSRPKSIKNECV